MSMSGGSRAGDEACSKSEVGMGVAAGLGEAEGEGSFRSSTVSNG